MSAEADDRKMAGARVSPDLHQRIRMAAARNEQSMAEYLRDLLEENVPELDD